MIVSREERLDSVTHGHTKFVFYVKGGYCDVNTLEPENKMKAAWERGKWVCATPPKLGRGANGQRGERVEEWHAPMSHAVGVKGDSSRVRPDSA